MFQSPALGAYTDLFALAAEHQLCGEASTYYTVRPTFEGVAQRARRILGNNIKLIYIVRDPVDRAISQHRFHYQSGSISPDINEALHTYKKLIDWSCYGMQVEPWITKFGAQRLHVVIFEDYVRGRTGELNRVFDFLSLPKIEYEIDTTKVLNRTTDLRRLRGFGKTLRNSPFYLKQIRPRIPRSARARFRWVWQGMAKLQRPLPPPPPITEETRRFIADSVQDDALRFAEMTGVDISAWKSLDV